MEKSLLCYDGPMYDDYKIEVREVVFTNSQYSAGIVPPLFSPSNQKIMPRGKVEHVGGKKMGSKSAEAGDGTKGCPPSSPFPDVSTKPHLYSTFSSSEKSNVPVSSKQSSSAAASTTSTEDILNALLPPREGSDGGRVWIQRVSSKPATENEVFDLSETLDKLLKERKARDLGPCSIREELYSQCFDEIIRQVTIVCADRGQLLARVRDHLRTTVAMYKKLYESAAAFGVRKAFRVHDEKRLIENENKRAESEIEELQRRIVKLKEDIHEEEYNYCNTKVEEEKLHQSDVTKLRQKAKNLKAKLEEMLTIEVDK